MNILHLVDESIVKNNEQEKRSYMGCSSIGHPCHKYIWHNFKGMEGKAFTAKQLRTFNIGKRLEEMMLDDIEQAGFRITRNVECVDDENKYFRGHCDAILHLSDTNSFVLELKTAKESEYKKFLNNGLKHWNMQYYSQCQAYMGMQKLKSCFFIVISKDTSEWHCECIEFDNILYSELQAKALLIMSHQQPPQKINENPCYWICQFCKFKELCHSRNDAL